MYTIFIILQIKSFWCHSTFKGHKIAQFAQKNFYSIGASIRIGQES